jgi:L-alanine-DL-glutamate epimerase-like enolase superfamily enzyme
LAAAAGAGAMAACRLDAAKDGPASRTASVSAASGRAALAPEEGGLFQIEKQIKAPVKIRSVELLAAGGRHFVRTTSTDGAVGIAITNERVDYLYPILLQLVIPSFIGKDARAIETLVDTVYVDRSNYKLAGLALWNPVGWVEFSIFDLLGKVAGKSVGELMGGVIRREVPVYLSSMRRDTTPEEEVAWLGRRLEETAARAVKIKIGGRMSRNRDAAPGRTERLVALARKTFGDGVAIHVDSNGSYDAAKAIEVGRMLEANRVYFYEEPCPFEELEETKRVADALEMPVAGGEQDASLPRFAWMIKNRVVDIVQPDVNYNGGFTRTARVARMAAAAGMPITPHSPATGPQGAYVIHFASCTPNMGKWQEWQGLPYKPVSWATPALTVEKGGVVKVPTGPGLGIEYDPEFLAKAEVVREK